MKNKKVGIVQILRCAETHYILISMRIGFVLAELSTGASYSMWPSVASMFPSGGKDTLVVFSGGRLNSPNPIERTRNSIYRFVAPENLDGAIIWSSSLTGPARSRDVVEAFRGMLGRPVVTIDGKTQGFPEIPDVRFDAYGGSSRIVSHCIGCHGARRIAYVRGPEQHNSAQERFRAFLDVMAANGLDADKSLITDPMPWEAGDAAVRQLLDRRGKVPGRDFDTILCASDLMLYMATLELSRRGYEVGRDYRACGFNDSLESRLLNVPVTTVRLPYAGLGVNSVLAFRAVAEGKPCGDKVLPTRPMFRRSCGCTTSEDRQSFTEISDVVDFVTDVFPIPGHECRDMLKNILESPDETNLRQLLDRICRCGADVFEVFELLSIIDSLNKANDDRHEKLRRLAAGLLPSVLDRNNSLRRFEERSIHRAFGTFNNELLATNRITEIAEVLRRNSSNLGFEKIHLVVDYEDRSLLVDKSRYFPASALVPDGKDRILDSGTWVVAPLCTETESMGYLLMKPSVLNGQACEDIRSSVSSALRSAMLFEATRRARQTAENAEQARTTFFANVGENLRDPLSEISGIVSESALDNETKKAVIDRVNGANNIIDLALETTGGLELDRCTESIDVLLSSFGCYEKTMALPCLMVDGFRIKQAFRNIVSSIGPGASIRAEVQRRGVHIEIRDGKGLWEPPKDDAGISLAQRIIILHNGTCSMGRGFFSAVLPFPTLSGEAPVPWTSGRTLACIGGGPPFPVSDSDTEIVGAKVFAEKKRLPLSAGALFWGAGFRGHDALTGLHSIIADEAFRNIPLLFSEISQAKTLEGAVRASMEAEGKVVLQVGPASEELYRWIRNPDVVSCDPGNAVSMARRHEPQLVIISMDDSADGTRPVIDLISELRGIRRMSRIPVIVSTDNIDEALTGALSTVPNAIVVNSCMLESEEFAMRVRSILDGAELLPT